MNKQRACISPLNIFTWRTAESVVLLNLLSVLWKYLWKVHWCFFTLLVILQQLYLTEIGPSHPSLPPCLTLSCGKSVADTQLSIIQEDWLLLVMLINNEMANLAASPRSLTLPHSGVEHFSALLTYDIAQLYIQQQNARLLCFISPRTNTSCIPLRGPCLRWRTSHRMWALPLS